MDANGLSKQVAAVELFTAALNASNHLLQAPSWHVKKLHDSSDSEQTEGNDTDVTDYLLHEEGRHDGSQRPGFDCRFPDLTSKPGHICP